MAFPLRNRGDSATVDDMTVTQKRPVTNSDRVKLEHMRVTALTTQAELKAMALRVLGYASFREVSDLTDISTNTLQRWKREAGK